MLKKTYILTSIIIIILSLFVFSTYKESKSQEIDRDEAYYNQKGLSHFNEGFYRLIPKGKKEEALQKYEQAIVEFKKAIKINEGHVEAHLNLARVYYVQKNFSEAAEEYKHATELNPYDIDVYIKLASSYARIDRFPEAVEQLEKAKTFTGEAVVINQLNDLIIKLEQVK